MMLVRRVSAGRGCLRDRLGLELHELALPRAHEVLSPGRPSGCASCREQICDGLKGDRGPDFRDDTRSNDPYLPREGPLLAAKLTSVTELRTAEIGRKARLPEYALEGPWCV